MAAAMRATRGAVSVVPTTSRIPLVPKRRGAGGMPVREGLSYKTQKGIPDPPLGAVVAPPRWLADEMVGRLARYLRFVGCDAEYVRGLSDEEILGRALAEDRVLLTRDRALARRAPRVVLIDSPDVEAQWRAVRAAWPGLPTEVRFERCSLCNGLLAPYIRGSDPAAEQIAPPPAAGVDRPLFRCDRCAHLYWEGSHTDQIRSRIASWCRASVP
jgi:uncharacterized protein